MYFPRADRRYSYITEEIRLVVGRIVAHTISRAYVPTFSQQGYFSEEKALPRVSIMRNVFFYEAEISRGRSCVPARTFSQEAKGYEPPKWYLAKGIPFTLASYTGYPLARECVIPVDIFSLGKNISARGTVALVDSCRAIGQSSSIIVATL